MCSTPRIAAIGAVVDLGQHAPRSRDLHRVDDETARDQRFERGDVVAVAEPLLDERDVGEVGAGRDAFLVDDPARRLGDVRVAFVEHQQQVHVAGLVAAVGFDRVVQPQHRRGRAALHDAAHRVERRPRTSGTSTRPAPRTSGSRCARSRAPTMTPSVPSEPRNTCERSGPTAARGAPPVCDQRAVGEHDVETLDDVLDLPVARRHLARAAARDPTADRRQRHRLRPVPARHAVLRAQVVFEHVAERARAHVDEHRGLVDADDAGEPGEVEQHAAEHGNARAAHAAAARGRGDRDARLVAQPQHGLHLRGVVRLDHDRRRAPRPARRAPRSSRAATSRGSPRRRSRPCRSRRRRSRAAARVSASSTSTRAGLQVIADLARAERDGRSRGAPVRLHAGRLRNQAGGCDRASSAVSGSPPARRSSATSAR